MSWWGSLEVKCFFSYQTAQNTWAGFTTGADESPFGAPIRKVPLGSAEMANSAWVKAGIKAEYIPGAGWDGVHGHGEFVVNSH